MALVTFAAKTSGLASVAVKPGLWFFALSVVLTALTGSAVEPKRPFRTVCKIRVGQF